MSEIYTSIKATFKDEKVAKEIYNRINSQLENHDWNLCSLFNTIHPIDNYEAYRGLSYESMEIKKATLHIQTYSGRIEPPTWIADTLTFVGASKIYFRMQYDEGGENFYFVDGRRVSKKKYDGDKPPKPLSAKDIEINKSLFLPEGRVTVKATLVSHWNYDDMYESIGLEFVTEDGQTFFHKGTGKLTNIISNTVSDTCEFAAVFERGRLNGEYVSFAKRPSKIKFRR